MFQNLCVFSLSTFLCHNHNIRQTRATISSAILDLEHRRLILLIPGLYALDRDLYLMHYLDKLYSKMVLALKKQKMRSCSNEPAILTLRGHEQSGM
jgi:hypothetical protein